MLTIDGSHGEGGGQILRTALSLAAALGRPVRIANIRGGRRQPGLRPQHVQAVQAAAAICNARLEGARQDSSDLVFEPQTPVQPGSYRFDIGTAGAASLVLQTVLAPLALAGEGSRITVLGGTHVPWSPPYHYLQEVFLPAVAPLGLLATPKLAAWGFYPRGGGEVRCHVRPTGTDGQGQPVWARIRRSVQRVNVLSAAANVGNQVAARQASQAYNRLAEAGLAAKVATKIVNPASRGPGTCLFLWAEYEGGLRAGFSGFGRKGYPAERVADDAVDAYLSFHATDAGVDPCLADQLVLPLILAGRELSFTTSQVTRHLLTNIWVVAQFLGEQFVVEGREGEPGRVHCLGP